MKADVLCAWCGKFMHHGETTDGQPSYGICTPCLHKYFPEMTPPLDLPDPTPVADLTPSYFYAYFARSGVCHLTANHQHTLCNTLINGRDKTGYHLGTVTAHKPDGRPLCSRCKALAAPLPDK